MKIILLLAIAFFAYKIVTVFKLIGNSNSNDDIKDEYKNFIFHSLVLVGLSVIMMIILFFFKGSESSVLEICGSLGNHAPTGCAERGPIFALQHNILRDPTNRFVLFFYFDDCEL